MKIIVFGSTGMVGQGVLRECLLDPDVTEVLTVVRKPTGQSHAKLRELVHADYLSYADLAHDLSGVDACFFCLGVSSTGMNEVDYTRVTRDFALAAARALLERNPGMTFIYVSGAGADSTEHGRVMWARVKGKAENAILALPFKAAYVFRPAFIQPMHGGVSRTKFYNLIYSGIAPLVPVLKRIFPKHITTTEHVGRAMLVVAKHGAPKRVLESHDIHALGTESVS